MSGAPREGRADARGGDVRGADARGARGTDARGTDARGTDARGADARGADARGADAHGARGAGARSDGAARIALARELVRGLARGARADRAARTALARDLVRGLARVVLALAARTDRARRTMLARGLACFVLALAVLGLGAALTGRAPAPGSAVSRALSPAPARAAPAGATAERTAPPAVRQDAVRADAPLPPDEAAMVARVIERNAAFLGARPLEFCRRAPAAERARCFREVEAIERARIDGALEVTENAAAPRVGAEWPGAGEAYRIEDARRVTASVPIRKGDRTASAEASVLVFASRRGDASERCFFPLEHWSWSDLDRPERFAHAPVGFCGKRTLTLTEYLVEQAPQAAPWAIRFLSEPEAKAWATGDPEKIKYESPYTAGHPYAKYFLLGSLRWWRGGKPTAQRRDYAWGVRIDRLPLRRLRELERSGELFLDVFEDGAQVELTNVTRAGLLALLAEKPVVFADRSGPDDRSPRLVPLEG